MAERAHTHWHQDDAKVQTVACGALSSLAFNVANEVTLVAAEAHARIICAMDRHQADAQVQDWACDALWSLAVNDANRVALMAAGVHERIIRAMDLHRTDAKVQTTACLALMNLGLALNDANKITEAQTAIAQI
jgi:hypothetical protein